MDANTLTNAAAAASSTAHADLAGFKGNLTAHARSMFQTPDRPTAISVIAWISAIGTLLSILGAVTLLTVGAIFWGVFALALSAVATVSTLGFFGMRKWAVVLYAGQLAFTIVMMAIQGSFQVLGLVLPAIVLAICAKYYSKMK